MSKQIIKTVEIQSGVSPDYLESTLTTDITVLESIFDLIDNSIDAARDHLISNKFEADKFGLPQDYSSYKISIRLGSNSICILDNCLGIDENSLSKKVFLTAGISNHKFGIGHYGLGLKRALLKFGNTFAMSSDNGNVAFKMHFNSEMIAGNKKFVAQAYNSNGFRKTLFIVSELKPSIIYEIKNKDWFENAVKMLGIRYAAYIAKGLKIILSNDYQHEIYRINGELPSLRTDSKIEPISKYLNIEGVNVYIDSGVHGSYYFPSEKDKHSIAMNKTLTDDFGLYFVCNDRVIVASSTANEYGWKTKWHSEYNGFVCIVRFVSEDSSKMPWNTMKTVLKTSSPMFVQVRNTLQPIADQYRQSAKKLYLNKNVNKKTAQTLKENNLTTSSLDLNEQQNKKSTSASQPNKRQESRFQNAGDNKDVHVKNWDTILPGDFPISKNSVLNAFITEAVVLKISAAPCASAMLLRSVLEKTLIVFIKKTGNYQSVKDYFYSTSEGQKKNHTEEQKKHQGIDLSMMLNWLKQNNVALDIFGIEEKAQLSLAARKASKHTQKLNGVVHGIDFVDDKQVSNIRNEIYPLLEFCVAEVSKILSE